LPYLPSEVLRSLFGGNDHSLAIAQLHSRDTLKDVNYSQSLGLNLLGYKFFIQTEYFAAALAPITISR
jgi:hypothetical protein